MADNTDHPLKKSRDPFIRSLGQVVTWTVRVLAVLMVFVIIWGVVDVIMHLYNQLVETDFMRLNIESLLPTFSAFLAVLIAIEIFANIIFYLLKDSVHVPLVLATALTAVARKVIVLEYGQNNALNNLGIAAIIFAVGFVYWLITQKDGSKSIS